MSMTSKERMMTALRGGVPDRLPVTIHQWQQYHLDRYMKGVDQLEAFLAVGLDASITPSELSRFDDSPSWRVNEESMGVQDGHQVTRHSIATPDGELTFVTASSPVTTYVTEHMIKNRQDAEIYLSHRPPQRLDRALLSRWYDRTGDAGIVRGFVDMWGQPGVWQDFCSLLGTQEAIFWAMDEPAFVHHFLNTIAEWKADYVQREMAGARYDLIEHGGGTASSTVISPTMFDEFCVPYDERVIAALHEVGLPVVYHTCGGMMAILNNIPRNGCDASETLSPPGVGGDIHREHRSTVKRVLGSKVSLIGGLDQHGILTKGTAVQVKEEVKSLFESFGLGGGYICSASDHFFDAPVENLRAMAEGTLHCRYQ